MGTIGEGGSKLPHDIKIAYQEKFTRSVDLFSKSLEGYHQADFAQKKLQFKKVMAEALYVMNEAAKAALGAEAKQDVAELQKRYDTIIANKDPRTDLTDQELIDIQRHLDLMRRSG